jgi:omega-amidase
LFRKIAKDVNVIFLIANWPSARDDHWLCLLRARAIENQCYIVGVNRVGKDENGIIYTGHSAVFDPWGNQIFLANEKDGLYIVNIEINKVIETRKNFPFLEDKKF